MWLGGSGEGKQRRLEVITVVESPRRSAQLSPTLLSCQQGLWNKTEIESDAQAARWEQAEDSKDLSELLVPAPG